MENLSFDCQGGKAGSGISLPQAFESAQVPQQRDVSQKPLSQAPLAAGAEVGCRNPEVGREAGTRGNEGAASPNPIRGGASEGRRTGDLVLAWLNHELALKTGVIDRQRIREWAAGLSEDEAERLLAGLWDWNRRVYGDWAAVA